MVLPRFVSLFGLLLLTWCGGPTSGAEPRFHPNDGDVVAFIGAGDVAADQFAGHLETLLLLQLGPIKVHFRNFGWEGDTVFEQPRDYGFPTLAERLKKAQVTHIFVQYGRAEALDGKKTPEQFKSAYASLLTQLQDLRARIVLVTPPPFERGSEFLPNLTLRNMELAKMAKVIRELAQERQLGLVDLFLALGGVASSELNLTIDGMQLSPVGHGKIAIAFARECGLKQLPPGATDLQSNGEWRNPSLEQIRQAVIDKNQLWFHYSRPQNWAFLGGDRVGQPSSRDHRDPNIRWFPAEMERYPGLIAEREETIRELVLRFQRK